MFLAVQHASQVNKTTSSRLREAKKLTVFAVQNGHQRRFCSSQSEEAVKETSNSTAAANEDLVSRK